MAIIFFIFKNEGINLFEKTILSLLLFGAYMLIAVISTSSTFKFTSNILPSPPTKCDVTLKFLFLDNRVDTPLL